MKKLRAKITVYDEDTDETIAVKDTYLTLEGKIDWDSTEENLGSLQRHLPEILKKLEDEINNELL